MSNFHFWGTIVTAIVFASLGYFIGGVLPLPSSFSVDHARYILAIVGVLMGFLTFSQIATWIIQTSTRLLTRLISNIASEVINQFTNLASKGWSMLPSVGQKTEDSDKGNQAIQTGWRGAVVLDTSSIIDGRILDVAKTGFIAGIILVPNFVLTELQQVADSADDLKRSRGRRGFEIVENLKKIDGIKIEVWDKDVSGKTVDDKLVRLGKIIHGRILTCDYNLNKVASLSGVRVLNLNDLSNALKALPVPGEKLLIKIVHEGKDRKQGVGYLADGTMVVVKDAANYINQEVTVEVNKILQGPAGRMLFGKVGTKE